MIIQRDLYKKIKPYINSPEAIVVTGMRRTGKTTLMRQIYDEIKSSNKLFLDLENVLNQKYFEADDYEKFVFSLKTLGLDFNKQCYVFLDEIQFVKNSPSIIKYLYDHYAIKFFLTGSSSFYLKNQFSESLAGRKYIFELYPLSFREFLLFKRSKLKLPPAGAKISEAVFKTFERLYEEYTRFGGFPAVALKDSFVEKEMVLKDIFSSYFQLEVMQLSDFRNTKAIRDLMLLLMQRSGTKVDIMKLSKELSVSRETIYNYLSFLENTYFIKLINQFSKSKDVEIRRSPKVYICDSGLLNNLATVEEGRVFENNIFQNLQLRGEVNYYQTKTGQEIDFILDKADCFEVKLSPSDSDMKKLHKISSDLKLKNCKVISKNYTAIKGAIFGFMV